MIKVSWYKIAITSMLVFVFGYDYSLCPGCWPNGSLERDRRAHAASSAAVAVAVGVSMPVPAHLQSDWVRKLLLREWWKFLGSSSLALLLWHRKLQHWMSTQNYSRTYYKAQNLYHTPRHGRMPSLLRKVPGCKKVQKLWNSSARWRMPSLLRKVPGWKKVQKLWNSSARRWMPSFLWKESGCKIVQKLRNSSARRRIPSLL